MVNKVKIKQCIAFPNQNENLTVLGLLLFGCQGELSPVPAARVELSPPIEGGDTWCEHNVEFLQQAKSARLA